MVETRKKEISLKDNATASTGGAAQVKNSDSGEAVSGADIVRFEKRGGGLDDKSGVAKVSIIYICCLCILPSRIGPPPTVTLNTVDRDPTGPISFPNGTLAHCHSHCMRRALCKKFLLFT